MKATKLPTPDAMLAFFDKDGYVTTAVTVARGLSSGDAAQTVEGLGKLAPPNSSLRIATEGTAAALRGDIAGAAEAILALAEKQEGLAPTVARIRSVERAVAQARGAVTDVRSAAKHAEEVLADPKKAATGAAKAAVEQARKRATDAATPVLPNP